MIYGTKLADSMHDRRYGGGHFAGLWSQNRAMTMQILCRVDAEVEDTHVG